MDEVAVISHYLRDPQAVVSAATEANLPLWLVCAMRELDATYGRVAAPDRDLLMRSYMTEAARMQPGAEMLDILPAVGARYGGEAPYGRALAAKSLVWATRLEMTPMVDMYIPPEASDLLPVLQLGDIHGLVAWLKVEMAKNSDYFAGLGWSAEFTPALQAAVVEFQHRHNASGRPPRVRDDGVIDGPMWRALNIYGITPR